MYNYSKNFIYNLFKKTFVYKKYYRPRKLKQNQAKLDYKREIFSKNGLSLLSAFIKIMNENGIPYWLEFGTLLGAFRDKGFIKNDFDFDMGVYLIDARKIFKALTNNGFRLVREFHVQGENGLEQTYEFNGVTIDLFYFFEDDNYLYCNGAFNAINQQIGNFFKCQICTYKFRKFSLCHFDFLGKTVIVPDNTEEHIIEVYGNGYKVYDPNFKDGFNKIKYSLNEKVGCGFFLS